MSDITIDSEASAVKQAIDIVTSDKINFSSAPGGLIQKNIIKMLSELSLRYLQTLLMEAQDRILAESELKMVLSRIVFNFPKM